MGCLVLFECYQMIHDRCPAHDLLYEILQILFYSMLDDSSSLWGLNKLRR